MEKIILVIIIISVFRLVYAWIILQETDLYINLYTQHLIYTQKYIAFHDYYSELEIPIILYALCFWKWTPLQGIYLKHRNKVKTFIK